MDGVHVVDKRLHGLVHALGGAVDGLLQGALAARQTLQRADDVVLDRRVIEVVVVLAGGLLDIFHLLDKRAAHVGGQIEVKCWDGLPAVHLVLRCLHRDAGDDAGCLDALGRTRLAVAGAEAVLQHVVQWMLHTRQALGGVVVLVMDVDVVVAHGLAGLLAQQVIVDKGLGAFAGKLHHHACWGVSVHVGVLTGDVVVLGIDDFKKDVARLGFAGHTAFVAVVDVASCHLLASALHQLDLHHVLDFLYGHLFATAGADAVGDALNEALVLACVGLQHGLADGGLDFLLVVAHNASVSFNDCLYHVDAWVF